MELPINYNNDINDNNNNNNNNKNKNKNNHNNKNEKIKIDYVKYTLLILLIYSIFITIYFLSKPNLINQVNNLYNDNQQTYQQIKTIKDILNWKIK